MLVYQRVCYTDEEMSYVVLFFSFPKTMLQFYKNYPAMKSIPIYEPIDWFPMYLTFKKMDNYPIKSSHCIIDEP
jgi:hypothetical protein